MLNNTGFDQWADEYDRSVARSDAAGSYPFAGYQEILNAIVDRVMHTAAEPCWTSASAPAR